MLLKARVQNVSIEDILYDRRFKWKGKKDWFYLKVFSPFGNGWVIFENKKKVFAAYFNDGFLEHYGSNALGRIASALRDCELEVGWLGKKVASLFAMMNPDTVVRGEREAPLAFMDARTADAFDVAVGKIDVSMFTEEWEEEGELPEKKEDADKDAGKGVEVDLEEASDVKEEVVEKAEPEVKKLEKKKTREWSGGKVGWVVSFEEFLQGLDGFTGICKGKDRESEFEVEVYLKDGKVVGAVVRDEDVEVKGSAALFYIERALEVELIEGDFEVPEGAECVEDGRSVEALYQELDRLDRLLGRGDL